MSKTKTLNNDSNFHDIFDAIHYISKGVKTFDDSKFLKIREYNKQRFINYCHKGTILQHATSKVKWEVLGLEDGVALNIDQSLTMHKTPYKFVKMQSLNGGAKTGKKYTKKISIEQFYMYDIIEVSDAVKVLWGDPKDNPPKSQSVV